MRKRFTLFLLVPLFSFAQNESNHKRCVSADFINYYNQKYPGYKEIVDQHFNDSKNLNRNNYV